MEIPSACLCSRKGPTYRTWTVAVEERDILINCQPEWPKCKSNVIYACYFNKVIILPRKKCNISLVLFSPGSVETDIGWGGKVNSHLMASCFRNICAINCQNLLILFKVTIDNVGVPFLRHSVYRPRDHFFIDDEYGKYIILFIKFLTFGWKLFLCCYNCKQTGWARFIFNLGFFTYWCEWMMLPVKYSVAKLLSDFCQCMLLF